MDYQEESLITSKHELTASAEECLNCGNKAKMYIVCKGEYTKSIQWYSYDDELTTGDYHAREFYILICTNCESSKIIELIDWDDNIRKEVLYPLKGRNFSHLPSSVSESYKRALKLLPLEPSAFIIYANRALELVCIDQKATGHNLNEKLNDLASQKIIPEILAELAHQIRHFRNQSAHALEVDISNITKEDIEELRDFCETVLDHIYEFRPRLEKVKDRLATLKAKSTTTP